MNDTVRLRVEEAVSGLSNVSVERILEAFNSNSFPGISESQLNEALVLAARSLVEVDPDYSYVAARLLLQNVRVEVAETIGTDPYDRGGLEAALTLGLGDGRIAAEMVGSRFDLAKLEEAIVPERDKKFQLLGAYTLCDRYFLHRHGRRYEMPQTFFMRVAMGLALNEDDPTSRAIEFYDMLSTFRFMSSTPTLFNSGTQHPQMSSCFLTTISDSLEGIMKGVTDNALLGKYSGGLGNDWTNVRASGSYIQGTNGISNGLVPWLKIAESTTLAVDQGGNKRPGAAAAYLETWHLDIEDFLDLRRNVGDERRRTHNLHLAHWIPDLFMERVEADAEWTLFSPDETPDLHDKYGVDFDAAYAGYEARAARGQIKNYRVISAKALWRKMLTRLFETGYPWMTFKDPSNLRSPQQHDGVVHSSNLCCVSASDRVVTDQGMLTVGELYKMQQPVMVSGRRQLEKGSVMYLPRPDAPMVRVHTKEGYTHTVTPDHKIWVVGKGRIEAQHIEPGEKIELQTVSQFGSEHDPETAFDMGRQAGHEVPDLVWRGSRQTQEQYLRGLYSTGEDTLVRSDVQLLRDVQLLWLNLGVKTTLSQTGDGVYSLSGSGFDQEFHATFTHLEPLPNEDAYCLNVDSDEHVWTVNGIVTSNTEITLNTDADSVAVCNLGSVNLADHVTESGDLDKDKLRQTVTLAIRMLDNVIDINYYTIPEARNSNLRHRPIGLGLMGFHDALFKKAIAYDSDEAVAFADESMEAISYYAIQASSELAGERGSYETFEGSLWSRGILPIDSIDGVRSHRQPGDAIMDTSESGDFDWDSLRDSVAQRGMRNSNVMAIAPTATIANIVGLMGQGIDPVFQNLYVKSSMSGDFAVINPYLIRDLKEFGLWSEQTRDVLKATDGSLQNIVGIPTYLKETYRAAFEIDPHRLVDAASRRQKWIDQSQSLNLYMEEPSGRKLDALYRHAWRSGVKSTYYLRSRGATQVEKSSLDVAEMLRKPIDLSGNPADDVCDSCQ